MGLFTARNRQNPWAERRKREAEAAAAAAAVPAPEPSKTPPTPPRAVPVDLNPDSEEYTQTPDISKFATGGIIEAPKPTLVEPSADEQHEQVDPAPVALTIPAETQAKIDAVMNRAVPVVADEPLTLDTLIDTMTDPGPAPSVEPQDPPEDEPKRGRGRPRPQETIDRDNAVHALLAAADETGVSKETLALSLDEKEQQVYSSLRQLSKEGRAETRYIKGHGYRWFAV